MVAAIWVKSVPEFYRFWDDFHEKYGDYFAEKIFSVYLQSDVYPLSYLLLDKYIKSDRDEFWKYIDSRPEQQKPASDILYDKFKKVIEAIE